MSLLLFTLLGAAALSPLVKSAWAGNADATPGDVAAGAGRHDDATLAEAYGKLPLSFEANRGQVDERVRFIARGVGYQMFLTPTEAVLALRDPSGGRGGAKKEGGHSEDARSTVTYRVLRMKLAGANEGAEAAGLDELPGKYNYFIGDDPARWRTDVPVYARAEFRGVYRGIDLVYYGNQRQLEYDFRVAPGADPRAIRLHFEGAERVAVGDDGDLVLSVAGGEVRMRRPFIYQLAEDGSRREVEGRYVVRGKRAAFEVGAYDRGRPLVIDPVLSYSSYLGAGGGEIGFGIAVDASGSAYVTGETGSSNFPTTGQNFIPPDNSTGHAFVTKLNPSGTALVYSTLVGGSSGETGFGIAVDASGSAYITGRTSSTNFPTVNAVRSNSNLIKSTDAGGSWAASNAGLGSLSVSAVAVDPSNASTAYAATLGGAGIYKSTDGGATWNALNTGFTSAAALVVDPQNPSTLYAAVNEIFFGVIKSTDGGATWAQVKNGLSGGGISALAIDPVTPTTVYAGTFGGVFKTTNGGANWTQANNGINFSSVSSIAIDPSNPATVYASASSGGVFKTTNGGANWVQMNAGLTNTTVRSLVVEATNPSVVYAATFGGGVFKSTNGAGSWSPMNTGLTNLSLSALVSDPTAPSTLYAGATKSSIFKTTNGGGSWTQVRAGLSTPSVVALVITPTAPSTVLAGLGSSGGSNNDREAFVTKLSPSGNALVYSTFLGGGGHDDGNAIAVNSAGQAHVAGTTASADFPLANPRQATLRGGTDAFVTKLDASGASLVYSTYLGGASQENGLGVAVDSAGNAYVTGDTVSADFTTTPGAFKSGSGGGAFVTKFDPSGSSLLYSALIGDATGFGVAVDPAGDAYVTGSAGPTLSVVNPIQPAYGGGFSPGDAFVSKLNAAGSALVYSTHLGGSDDDYARGIALDLQGNVYVAGTTRSRNFPITRDALKSKSALFVSGDGGMKWGNAGTAINVQGVNAVTVDPSNPLTVYAGTTNGIFKSTDGGRNWLPVNNGLTLQWVVSIAVDPQTPSTVYAATTILRTGNGVGVFKSTDGGQHWGPINSGLSGLYAISDVLVDPSNPQTLYLGTRSGVFKSTNGGASWANVYSTSADIYSLAIDPTNTQTVYASAFSSPGGVFKTTDGGANWGAVGSGLGGNPVAQLRIDPQTPSTLYASTTAGIYKTTDGGALWTLKRANAGHYAIALDPKRPATIYAAASRQAGGYVLKSQDGGSTWFPSGAGLLYPVDALAVSALDTNIVYAGTDTFGEDNDDIFVVKINAAGSALAYSTYLGGTGDGGSLHTQEFGTGVAVDAAGNAYVTGATLSPDFPTTPGVFQPVKRGGYEVFVSKLSSSFTVGGRVADAGGNPQAGVKITLGGSALASQYTGADGTYSFVNLPAGGSFTVGATKAGLAFAPPSHSFDNLDADRTADFTASPSSTPFHTIAGRIAEADGTPVGGVRVTLGGSQFEFTLTDGGGDYSFTAPAGGSYTVTPALHGFLFAPASQTVNNLGANQTVNFTAVRQSFVVTNTNDSGPGSLRQAITDANAIPGRDTLVFNIPGTGVKTISPDAALPDLIGPVVIDATTQPGYAGSPLVELDGNRGGLSGLRLTGGDSVVRGLAIFRFLGSGIALVSNGNVVEGCHLGITAAGAGFQHSNNAGITVSGANNRIGGTTPAARNVISGNLFEGVAVFGAGNQIKGNFIGTNPAGTAAVPNGTRGIEINSSTDPAQTAGNVIGGTEPGARNVVVGNGNGAITTSAVGTVIQGNFIGTDVTGTVALGLTVGINLQGRNSTVGGTTPAARNVISGQGLGINVSAFSNDPQNVIQGNYIGLDVSGTRALGSGGTGIEVNSSNTSIGGTEPGAGNVISGTGTGINCRLGSAVIRGNLIGTDASGNLPVENQSGIVVSSNNNVIGGVEPGARNVISGNIVGVQLGGNTTATPTGNIVQGNFIGTNAAGTAPLPNTLRGVSFDGASGNQIGGDEAGAGNLIAFNRTGLVMSVFQNVNNRIQGNSIFSNALLGIDLNADFAVTPNDALDPDTGANNLQNFPRLMTVTSSGGSTHVEGTLNSTPNTQFRVDFYSNLACDASGSGEGTRAFGSTTVTTDPAGNAAINVDLGQALAAGRVLTATATDPSGNTSEFSPCDASKAAGSLEFEFADVNVLEDVGSAIITVVRRGGSLGAVSVNYATAPGTATAGSDYTAASGTLTFNAGETAKTFAVPVADDGLTEAEETVRLTLGGVAELESLGGQATATLHIFDSNTPLLLSVEFPNGTPPLNLPEGDAGRRNNAVTVKLNAATGRTVTVDFATVAFANNATPSVDFEHVSGSLTFAPGVERRQVLVPVIGDTLDENNEVFGLALSNAAGAAAQPNPFNITILDDDPLPALSVGDVTVVEGPGAKAAFTVRLSAVSGRSVFVGFSTTNGTATAGADYTQTQGLVTFNPGETIKTVEVPILSDAVAEADETFTLGLLNPTRATIADPQGVATITESSSVSLVQFSAASYGIPETDHFVDVNVTRTGDTSGEASVAYETVGQTASDKSDFTASLGSLRFGPGESSKTFRVLVTNDVFQEPAESLDLVLSNPTGAALGGPSAAVLTITSDDAASGPSPVKDASLNVEFFVRQHYADFLSRVPDQAGLDFWVGRATGCGNPDLLVCRINVSAAFFLSIENQETGYLTHRAYKVAFGNLPGKPVPLTLREYLSGSRQIGDGVQVGVGAWEQQLEANKVAFFEEFVATSRFTTLYPQGMANGAFVDALNQNAGGALSQAERDALINGLDGGTLTRAQAVRAAAEDSDFAAAERNRAFVLAQYFGYLRRNPDDVGFGGQPDPAFEGYNFWLGRLNAANGNFVQAEMVKAFIQSIEYGERFGQ